MLADDAYWFTQHDVTGVLRTSERAASVMVAAAMLGELVAQQAIGLRAGEVVALLPAPELDVLGTEVVRQITSERQRYTAADWIEFLAHDIRDRVARRLISSGEAQQRRVGVRRRTIAVAKFGDTRPAWVHAGLVSAAQRGELFAYEQRFLLGLAWHSSMTEHPLAELDEARLDYLRREVERIEQPFGELLTVAVATIRSNAVAR